MMGGIRGNYCSACGRHLMYCQCGESCSASERQGEAAAPVAEGVALPPLPPIDEHWMTNDHTYTAEQVRQAQREAVEADRRARGMVPSQMRVPKQSIDTPEFRRLLDAMLNEYWEPEKHHAIIVAYIDARTAGPAVPEGYVIVPVEATYEMERAAMSSKGASTGKHMESPKLLWRDMIAAAPKPLEDA